MYLYMFHYTREFSWRSGAGGNLKISFRVFGGRTARESIAGIPLFSLLALRLGEFGGLDAGRFRPRLGGGKEGVGGAAAGMPMTSKHIENQNFGGVHASFMCDEAVLLTLFTPRLVVVWRLTAARLRGSGCGFQRV
jgi:hypothetical protein